MENKEEKSMIGIDISDKEYEEIVKKSVNEKNISDTEKQKLIKTLSSLSGYEQELDKTIIPGYNKKVIFTNGNKQLQYENGEFFEASSTDATKERVKLTRKEATDKYIEYFIANILNPLIARKKDMGIEFKKKEVNEIKKEVEEVSLTNKNKKQEKSKEDIDLEL